MAEVIFEFHPAISPFYWVSRVSRFVLVWAGAVVSIIGIPIVLYAPSMRGLSQDMLRQSFTWWPYVIGMALFAGGLALSTWARLHLYPKCYYVDYQFSGEEKVGGIATTGPYHYMRHPNYAAGVLVAVGITIAWYQVSYWSLLIAPVILLLSAVCVYMEELFLKEKFPEDYDAYRSRVPIVPGMRGSNAQLGMC